MARRFKKAVRSELLKFSSSPPSIPCSIFSSVTTLKVYMSWCKNENPRVIELVDRLREALWEKGIEVNDSGDVEDLVGEKLYPPIIICTVSYFNDADCLEEFRFISKHKFPLFYNPDGDMKRFFVNVSRDRKQFMQPITLAERRERNNNNYDDDDDDDDDDDYYDDELSFGAALNKISMYSKWIYKYDDPVFIQNFAHTLWVYLNPAGLDYTSLVDLESRVNPLKTGFERSGAMYHVVEGPEGSGKTTIAKFLYNCFSTIHTHFRHTRMIAHPSSMPLGKLATHIFDNDFDRYRPDYEWKPKDFRALVDSRYGNSPLLIILDNIDTADDYDHVAPVLSILPNNGSKVVITARDTSWLTFSAPKLQFEKHHIRSLDIQSSLELFCLKAFKENQPPEKYRKLAKKVVLKSKGVPLDLVYCASQFRLMSKDDSWKVALESNEDMDSLFWERYVPRSPKPIATRGGSCHPSIDECTIGTTFFNNQSVGMGYSELWKKICAMKVSDSECV